MIKEAELRSETLRKEKELEAKEKFVQLKSAHDKEVLERNRKAGEAESRIRQKEQTINQKEAGLDKQIKDNEAIKENLNRQIDVVNLKRTELEKHQEEHIRRLEKIAGLTADEARNQLIESLRNEAQTQAIGIQHEIIDRLSKRQIKKAERLSFKRFSARG
jgi:ribonuclease Y